MRYFTVVVLVTLTLGTLASAQTPDVSGCWKRGEHVTTHPFVNVPKIFCMFDPSVEISPSTGQMTLFFKDRYLFHRVTATKIAELPQGFLVRAAIYEDTRSQGTCESLDRIQITAELVVDKIGQVLAKPQVSGQRIHMIDNCHSRPQITEIPLRAIDF